MSKEVQIYNTTPKIPQKVIFFILQDVETPETPPKFEF